MENQMDQGTFNSPAWWKDDHTSAWDRVKTAFRRDWEQTKADLSATHGTELDQNAADTVKQAVGAKPAPPVPVPNPPEPDDVDDDIYDFDEIEPAARFGFGARTQYSTHGEWDEGLEAKLREDWKTTGSTYPFDEAKPHVRSGWDFAGAKPTDETTKH